MVASLESCSPEIIEIIVSFLNVTDAGNLRLTNRSLRLKATQGHFKSFFRSKRVRITGPELKDLTILTQNGWLGCEIRDLILVGVVNNTMRLDAAVRANPDDPQRQDLEILLERQRDYEQFRDSKQIVRLLKESFSNIAANSSAGKLRSLSLEATVYRRDATHELPPRFGGSWRLIWQITAETFQIVLSALRGSNLAIGNLDVFNGSQLQRCSIASNALCGLDYRAAELSTVLGYLSSLSISLSEQIIDLTPQEAQSSGDSADEIGWSDDEEWDIEEILARGHEQDNFTGLSKLIQGCQYLKVLEIHHYRVNSLSLDSHHHRIFQSVAEMGSLPPLEGCTLRGVFLREVDLLAFVKQLSMSLRRLSLQTVRMASGTFRSIFDYLASDVPSLESLYFDELLIGRDLVHFTDAGEPRFQT